MIVHGNAYFKHDVVVVDVEASSLGRRSYPIECAWVSLTGDYDEFLINPNSVNDWDDWDLASEKIHGIDRDILKKGFSVYEAATRLNRSLRGCLVISDCAGNDSQWIGTLFKKAGIEQLFDIVDILDIAVAVQKNAEYQKFRENKNKITVTHRALPDCFQNLEMYLSLGLIEN